MLRFIRVYHLNYVPSNIVEVISVNNTTFFDLLFISPSMFYNWLAHKKFGVSLHFCISKIIHLKESRKTLVWSLNKLRRQKILQNVRSLFHTIHWPKKNIHIEQSFICANMSSQNFTLSFYTVCNWSIAWVLKMEANA